MSPEVSGSTRRLSKLPPASAATEPEYIPTPRPDLIPELADLRPPPKDVALIEQADKAIQAEKKRYQDAAKEIRVILSTTPVDHKGIASILSRSDIDFVKLSSCYKAMNQEGPELIDRLQQALTTGKFEQSVIAHVNLLDPSFSIGWKVEYLEHLCNLANTSFICGVPRSLESNLHPEANRSVYSLVELGREYRRKENPTEAETEKLLEHCKGTARYLSQMSHRGASLAGWIIYPPAILINGFTTVSNLAIALTPGSTHIAGHILLGIIGLVGLMSMFTMAISTPPSPNHFWTEKKRNELNKFAKS